MTAPSAWEPGPVAFRPLWEECHPGATGTRVCTHQVGQGKQLPLENQRGAQREPGLGLPGPGSPELED